MADHFVIDGSNLATEGRTEPSLAQLREAVAAFRVEHPDARVTVVVDASFEHRIDPSERGDFAKAEIASEVVSPPAGAVGRGDGFLLQIANRTNASVLSNDSFQEFHAEYEWLFEPGRLLGGKPVPGVGWIFSLRRPVRGIVSRKTTQKAKKEARDDVKVRKAIAEATADALTTNGGSRRRRRGSGKGNAPATAEPDAVNQPAPFLQFLIDHRLGTEVEGTVDAFSSHGAFVEVGDVRCYIPLSAMGDPRPTRARDVLNRGEVRSFVVQAVDAPRRGIELALPGFAKVAGAPSEETVAADVKTSRPRGAAKKTTAPAKKAPAKKTTAKKTTAKKTALKKTALKKTTAKKTTAKKATDEKALATKTPAKKAAGTKTPTKKTAAKKTTAKKAAGTKTPAKKAAAKKTTAKKAAGTKTPAKKAAAKKTPSTKAPAKKAAAKKSATPPTKTTTPPKKPPATATPLKEARAKKAAARKRAR